jgi:Na+-driven multidrug efflux pump
MSEIETQQQGASGRMWALFFPIALMTSTNYIVLLIEKCVLAQLSIAAMEAAVAATYVCQLFQLPTVVIAMMTQVSVAKCQGAGELEKIGPRVWQFIWFSFLSMAITLPSTWIYGQIYFSGSEIEELVTPYYRLMAASNFLYPLTMTLSCFYLGQGRTRFVFFSTVGFQLLKLGLAIFLIFGRGSAIPAYGLLGGAISTVIAQFFLCVMLFMGFLSTKGINARDWLIHRTLFLGCMRPGMLRASNRMLNLAAWASVVHLMTTRGGDHLLVMSLGGTFSLFLAFLPETLAEVQVTMVGQMMGRKQYASLKGAFYSGLILALSCIFLVAIPLVLFPMPTMHYFFPNAFLSRHSIYMLMTGLWLSFAFFALTAIPYSYILAFKDTKFIFRMGLFSWINGFLVSYILLEVINVGAEYFWFVNSICQITTFFAFYFRMRWLQEQVQVSKPLSYLVACEAE